MMKVSFPTYFILQNKKQKLIFKNLCTAVNNIISLHVAVPPPPHTKKEKWGEGVATSRLTSIGWQSN